MIVLHPQLLFSTLLQICSIVAIKMCQWLVLVLFPWTKLCENFILEIWNIKLHLNNCKLSNSFPSYQRSLKWSSFKFLVSLSTEWLIIYSEYMAHIVKFLALLSMYFILISIPFIISSSFLDQNYKSTFLYPKYKLPFVQFFLLYYFFCH